LRRRTAAFWGKALAPTDGRLLQYRVVLFVEAEIVTDLEIDLNPPAISKRQDPRRGVGNCFTAGREET
jgi:hypothetical protein